MVTIENQNSGQRTNAETGTHQTETQQILTFHICGEEYGVDILTVHGIRGWEGATEMPNTPDYIKGVINLRGAIIPLIDLRKRFDFDGIEYSKTNVVIILSVEFQQRERTIGIVVDGVSDVVTVSMTDIHPPPEFGENVSAGYTDGLATIDEKVVMLLDPNKLMDFDRLVDAADNDEIRQQ
jgi:purine-binding chemotaxis protein CheW